MTDALVLSAQKKSALGRLIKVHTLLKGLEKIAASADIPMLYCQRNSMMGFYEFWQVVHNANRCFARLHPRVVNCRKKKCGHSNQVCCMKLEVLYSLV
nr:Ubiquitin-60S ribosomal protein L40-2 [Ipomoea batatas]